MRRHRSAFVSADARAFSFAGGVSEVGQILVKEVMQFGNF
jgi:hypothetical protein